MSLSSRALALDALLRWRTGESFADAIVHELLRDCGLGESDRAFTIELFYGSLRNLRLLDFWITQLRTAPVDDDARDILRLGLYQVLFLETPAHAAVHATVEIAPARLRPLINGVLRSALRQKDELRAAADRQPISIRFSHPEFLVEQWEKHFGCEAAEKICRWNNQPASVYARPNELRVSLAEFAVINPGAIRLPNRPDFFELRGSPVGPANRGECYVQDPSTSLACELLDPQPGEAILDACAAPGGKSGYLAQMMRNEGLIIATDRDGRRLPVLEENLGRLGVRNARVQQCDWLRGAAAIRHAMEQVKAPRQFERILVDAPCSNTGVMRRRIDVRWRLQVADLQRMARQQLRLLRALLPLLQTKGVLVYSTCSLESEENEEIIQQLTAEFPALELLEQRSSLPFRDDFDGAFAAKLRLT